MSIVKQKMLDFTTPAISSRGSFITLGRVTESYEKTNSCDIRFIDKEGNSKTVKNVAIKTTTPGLIAWFPQKGDRVIIEAIDSMITIIGPEMMYYTKDFRSKYQLKKETLDSNPGGTLAGQIF